MSLYLWYTVLFAQVFISKSNIFNVFQGEEWVNRTVLGERVVVALQGDKASKMQIAITKEEQAVSFHMMQTVDFSSPVFFIY